MLVKFHCPHCEGSLEAEAHVAGYETDCPHCGKTIKTPGTGIYPGLVLDDMRIERSLGRGSMGEVYLARQQILDRKVALKILPSSLTASDSAVERFMKEIRLLAKLSHPNIVSAYSAGEAMGIHYLAMSYVRGETMAMRLQRKEWMAEEDALAVGLCVARALNYAWEKHHLLHRDIKPGNIMVDQDGEIKLMDMGLSKSLHEEGEGTQTGMLLGTPHYMSPEQADCRSDLDCRADIYGLGATLYHMVTGTPPYPGATVPEILKQQLNAPLIPVRERNAQVTNATAALIEKMMRKDREERHQTWGELIEHIEHILLSEFPDSDVQTSSIPAMPSEHRLVRPRRKRRGPMFALLLLVLAALGTLDVLLIRNPELAVNLRNRIRNLLPAGTTNDAAAAAISTPGPDGPLMGLMVKRLERNRKSGEYPVLQRLPAPRIKEMILAMEDLDAKAAPLIRTGQLAEAAKLYESYEGAFAAESLPLRRAAARLLLDESTRGTNKPPRP